MTKLEHTSRLSTVPRCFEQVQVDFNGRLGHMWHLLSARADVRVVAWVDLEHLLDHLVSEGAIDNNVKYTILCQTVSKFDK